MTIPPGVCAVQPSSNCFSRLPSVLHLRWVASAVVVPVVAVVVVVAAVASQAVVASPVAVVASLVAVSRAVASNLSVC